MDINKLRKLSKKELELKLDENHEILTNYRFQKVLQQLEKPQAIRATKREIAKIKTLIREFDLHPIGKESK